MRCVLCGVEVTLLDLDPSGWQGEPAHTWCSTAAQEALDEAIDNIAALHRARNDRLGKRYDRLAG